MLIHNKMMFVTLRLQFCAFSNRGEKRPAQFVWAGLFKL
jgi:hypothetical protein